MNKALVASMEAIDFQRDSVLLSEMAMQFDACFKNPSRETLNAAAAALNKIATKHTGMKFRFNFIRGQGPTAFVLPPQADVANPMQPNEIATKVKRLGRPVSEQELFKGTVNIATGKVSGIYSEIPVDIFIGSEFFNDPRMGDIRGIHLAAIACHEMGHGFTYLRYLGKLVISNVAITEIITAQHESRDDKIVMEVVKVAEQRTGWRLRDLGEINSSTDPLVIQQIVMASMVESIRSELGTKFYDIRAFEFSSDQFVARHGGAQYIVEALDYLYRAYPSMTREYRGKTGNIVASLQGYLGALTGAFLVGAPALLAAKIGVGAAIAGAGASFFLVMAAGVFLVIFNLFDAPDNGVYDPIEKRYQAMRRELIASSKDQNLSNDHRLEIIKQITAIDEIVNNLSHKSYFGPEVVTNYIIGIFSKKPGEQKFQRMLENMANNRLFELSNQLQTKMV